MRVDSVVLGREQPRRIGNAFVGDAMQVCIGHQFIENLLRKIRMGNDLVFDACVGKSRKRCQHIGKHSGIFQ